MKILATVGAFALGLISEDVVWIFSNLIGKPMKKKLWGVCALEYLRYFYFYYLKD